MVYTIGKAAERVGYSPQNLKLLELRGVVRPQRSSDGRRLYTDADLAAIEAYRQERTRKVSRGR